MARVRRGFKARRRRNKVLKLAKGFHFDRRTKYKHTAETVKRALNYAYVGRRLLKRDMRKLWVVRIAAAARTLETSYSKFIGSLKANNVTLNRKMLAEIAATDFAGFTAIKNALKK
ncbi:50S ribosomal protein L20 [Bacteriovorax stolpii]|uniref:Large ribosomal subunit protein bL20 n=1 Tax=Bacteriovorax stolpii TaxID=960 RepID=A0A2K9NSZ9_BACTC|nr:50S ribosomal protein L20 [Bacteriovorax stolpii]AUN98649.1 50S ribosomal protein L20 [Bacteriovorax stolpii]QDK41371.1 50S ribosomal protein L20 [Bacteriovorax stolpii]TDP55844.1 LSU ribosomal protein L20P [Bacteriovorax stolpii]BDT28778.1 50S ribosomal protein L20 [Bacteriovorax sp. HI3]